MDFYLFTTNGGQTVYRPEMFIYSSQTSITDLSTHCICHHYIVQLSYFLYMINIDASTEFFCIYIYMYNIVFVFAVLLHFSVALHVTIKSGERNG